MEHILILSQMGKRLVQQSRTVELNSDGDFSRHVEKSIDLTPQPPSLQGKGENSKPLSLQERGLERGFSDPVKSQNSDVTQQLASAAHFEHVYKSGLAQIAETQYDSLEKVQDTIALVSELNLVYIMRSAGKIFTAASPAQIPTNAPVNKAPVISPPQKKDSVVLQYIRRAQDLIAQNQLTQARVELQDALKLEPNNSRCHSLIGVVYLKQNLTTSAKVHFNRALQLNPKDEIALAGRLKVEQITGQKPSGAKRTASPNIGGSGLFGGLFGGKKK